MYNGKTSASSQAPSSAGDNRRDAGDGQSHPACDTERAFRAHSPKEDASDPVASTEDSAIKPFAVCTDVELGPLLEVRSKDRIRETWKMVEKNKSSSDPGKTKKEEGIRPFTKEEQDSLENGTTTFRALMDKLMLVKKEERERARSNVEAVSDLEASPDCNPVFDEFSSINLLAKAVHISFYNHYPLRLGPDVIWLTILQGLAKHIDKNPEMQRKNFVNFEGKKTLSVSRPNFSKGSPDNDWTTVFPEFAGMIADDIGKEKVDAMTCDFTTSTPTDQICSHIVLMDTVKHYFEYRMLCGCGIPSIELAGTEADWVALRTKAEILCQFDDLEWWTPELFPVLDHFVQAAKGNPDIKFWKSVCNLYGASDMWSSYVTGWVQVFFPYSTTGNALRGALGQWRKYYENATGQETEDYNRGVHIHGYGRNNLGGGLELKDIPVGVSQAPFEYIDLATGCSFDMTFNGGIVAIVQNSKTRALEPVTGWAVLDHGAKFEIVSWLNNSLLCACSQFQ